MKDTFNAVLEDLSSGSAGPRVGVKANISVKGHAAHGGIKAYSNDLARKDARVITRLRKAGYNIAAILNMEEGALGAQTNNPWFGKTYNPLKAGYTAGGSSGGSAAAVAAGLMDAALGTDTMGSVRIPSAYCGIWGFKPSHDLEMLGGVMPLSPSLDTVGSHARSLDEVTALTEIICSRNFSAGRPHKIYRLDWEHNVICAQDIDEVFENFVAEIGSLKKTSISPYEFSKSRRAGLIISEVEGYKFHKKRLKEDPAGFSEFFKNMLTYGTKQPAEKIEAAYAHMKDLRAAEFPDFVLMPTAPQTAFKFGDPIPANQADFTAFANLADRPAICFPIGKSKNGLPVSAQLVGPRGGEADLVATVKTLPIPESHPS